ncbi:hypothetical protein IID62_09790 [candidate division KSB1 bacterium]|nr:hypothetical protein [candidate division KSB1 bacterium]
MSYEKTSKKPLIEQLKSFRKWRNWIAIPLIAIGVISLLLPILPGILIIFLGIMLINPELADRIREKVTNLKKKFVG